ncbi:MAG: DPP IV N-terminal domain-containing protein [Bacteroidales bacterium]|nr:DPP IV N-terminal domain-containing protein [Bacteroidales bacterium]
MKKTALFPVLFIMLLVVPAGYAQDHGPVKVTKEDYARAEKFLMGNTFPLVHGYSIRPVWISQDYFWYRHAMGGGTEFLLVNARKKNCQRAFDHKKLAAALSEATGNEYKPLALPFYNLSFSKDRQRVTFRIKNETYTWDIPGHSLSQGKKAPQKSGPDRKAVVSPDGKHAAFIRDYNLWARDLETGEEKQLTTDGEKDYGYATDNAGWRKSDRPVLLWSPDSKKIATFRMDERGVGMMYMVSTKVGHPGLEAWRYPLPEDTVIFRIHRVVVFLKGPRVVRLKMNPDPHRSTIADDIAGRDGKLLDVEWSPDATRLAFVSTSRNHQKEVLRVADAETGEVRDVLEEEVHTFFESGFNKVNWHFLPETNEVIWYSRRDNWGHLYLYDLTTGTLKNRITSGSWNVLDVQRIDRKNRKIYFIGNAREPGDPYFKYLYSVGMDGRDLKLLTPDSANHSITFSPSGRYFTDSYSTPVKPPVTVLRTSKGKKLLTLGKADITELQAAGWQPPVPFIVKARDGVTDLYGLMFKPTNFDPSGKYPIINAIYPGPQTGSIRGRSFLPSRGDKQALAELGFIVVSIDAMGTPMRSKSFHAAYYGDMGDNGLPDQIAGMRQLAERYPWIDSSRVGIYGHSGGGYAAADAILRYPAFFRVAVSESGNHDNRIYEDDWGEKWQGLLKVQPDGTTNYDNQANQNLAKNLQGHLLLAHGTMDDNVPLNNTLMLVKALIAANKDFDLILFPNRHHGYGPDSRYMMRRKWDYFVRYLLNTEPPKEYEFGK